jgi:hypothetical protein
LGRKLFWWRDPLKRVILVGRMWQPITDVISASPPPPPPGDDRITMLLTAVGVIAAFGGIMLGISALYMGYLAYRGKKDLEAEARKMAQKIARREARRVARLVAEEYLQSNETLAAMYEGTTEGSETPIETATSNESEQVEPDHIIWPEEEEHQ